MKLMTLPGAFGVRCASPFALKAEVLLHLGGFSFEREMSEPRFGPRKKMPVLIDGDLVIPDTRNIQSHLETVHGANYDGHLSNEQRALGNSVRRLCEEHLYWAQLYFRWADHADLVRDTFFSAVPRPFRGGVFGIIQRKVRRDLWGHGFGRMSRPEMLRLAEQDLASIRTILDDRAFLFGDRPTSFDATVYPLILNLLAPETPTDLTPFAEPLRPYVERMETFVFCAKEQMAAS